MNDPGPIKITALATTCLLLAASLFLTYERQGLLPLLTILLSVIGLVCVAKLDNKKALYCAILIVCLSGFGWAGAIYYVYSNWESGEVVDIRLSEEVTFRTWLIENGEEEIVIYDSPPEHQPLVEGGGKAWLKRRDNKEYSANLRAVPVSLDSGELANVYALYEQKYADQSSATDVYYLLIGPRRGSQLYVLYLTRKPDHR